MSDLVKAAQRAKEWMRAYLDRSIGDCKEPGCDRCAEHLAGQRIVISLNAALAAQEPAPAVERTPEGNYVIAGAEPIDGKLTAMLAAQKPARRVSDAIAFGASLAGADRAHVVSGRWYEFGGKLCRTNEDVRLAHLYLQVAADQSPTPSVAYAPAPRLTAMPLPLSEERILAIVAAAPALETAEAEWLHVVRAVEREHGITTTGDQTP
jgi:hypothetical protein